MNMDKRFLARGKRIDTGEWVLGLISQEFNPLKNEYYIAISEIQADEPNRKSGWFVSGRKFTVDSATIGQCTGSPDKNGKIVFTDDILKIHDGEYTYNTRVYWSESRAGFAFLNPYGIEESLAEIMSCDIGRPLNCVEIIGNIHDNPELLGR